MKPFRLETRADRTTLFILGLAFALCVGLGIFQWTQHHEIYEVLFAISFFLLVPLGTASSVHFTADDADIVYHSLFADLRVRTDDVVGLAVVVERKTKAPQGVPRFYLVMRDGQRHRLNIKVLPLRPVRQFCTALRERGVSVHVQDALMAKRMASQIFI